jgi:hypothetical protein
MLYSVDLDTDCDENGFCYAPVGRRVLTRWLASPV